MKYGKYEQTEETQEKWLPLMGRWGWGGQKRDGNPVNYFLFKTKKTSYMFVKSQF